MYVGKTEIYGNMWYNAIIAQVINFRTTYYVKYQLRKAFLSVSTEATGKGKTVPVKIHNLLRIL